MESGKCSQKRNRGAIEKQRRVQMKNLYSKLASLLPPQPSKVRSSLPATLEKAHTYIKGLNEKIDKLKVEKERLQSIVLPSVLVNETDSFLEVNVITGLNNSFRLHEALIILEEEGAVVFNVHRSTQIDRIMYTIRSQAFSARIGIATSRVHERLIALTRTGLASEPTQPSPIWFCSVVQSLEAASDPEGFVEACLVYAGINSLVHTYKDSTSEWDQLMPFEPAMQKRQSTEFASGFDI